MSKNITRIITTGYVYDVMKRDGISLVKTGEIITPAKIRSIKQQKLVLAENKMDIESVMLLNRANEKKYVISESDFIKYSKEVTDVTETEPATATA